MGRIAYGGRPHRDVDRVYLTNGAHSRRNNQLCYKSRIKQNWGSNMNQVTAEELNAQFYDVTMSDWEGEIDFYRGADNSFSCRKDFWRA